MMGREQEARAEAAEVLRINPKFSLDNYAAMMLAGYKDQSETDKVVDALRKAGLDEVDVKILAADNGGLTVARFLPPSARETRC